MSMHVNTLQVRHAYSFGDRALLLFIAVIAPLKTRLLGPSKNLSRIAAT
jgi:hypothetical protein